MATHSAATRSAAEDAEGGPAARPAETAETAGDSAAGADRVAEPWEELHAPLLVDEPHLKVWLEVVKPGETHPAHTHRHPWVTVVISGGSGESWTSDGELIMAGTLPTGHVQYNGPEILPRRHYVKNTGETEVRMIAVEMRDPASPGEQNREDGHAHH
ncbi:hypothetical protein [Allostreptomyces psammosilenae]|uniref:Quercetin dioxygenase-like cupin family protein n=1 Tax=Allostreptomyces psammosilenae TaxID=1892865 RepID=A0A853A321_9ACTN|nr:hypothetical protein [Allostreptomyces psammosilenae]NYI04912.1 quercetin dioxygenase-like cupin family protein [Allostreptomyces psammosilenae]